MNQNTNQKDKKSVNYVPGLKCNLCSRLYKNIHSLTILFRQSPKVRLISPDTNCNSTTATRQALSPDLASPDQYDNN